MLGWSFDSGHLSRDTCAYLHAFMANHVAVRRIAGLRKGVPMAASWVRFLLKWSHVCVIHICRKQETQKLKWKWQSKTVYVVKVFCIQLKVEKFKWKRFRNLNILRTIVSFVEENCRNFSHKIFARVLPCWKIYSPLFPHYKFAEGARGGGEGGGEIHENCVRIELAAHELKTAR